MSKIQLSKETDLSAFRSLSQEQVQDRNISTANKLSVDLINQLETEISNNQLTVNQEQRAFKIYKTKPEATAENDPNKKLHQVLQKKQLMQRELEEIEKEEEKIKSENQSHHQEKKYYKSELTKEDIEYIKKLKILQKKHEIELENKTKLYQENLKKFETQEKQLLEKQKKEQNQQRLREVAKNIQDMRERQEERLKKIEEEKRRLVEIKKQKKLYEKMNQNYKIIEIQEERKKQQLKQRIKNEKLVNFEDIREHQKKYDDIMRNQKEERQKKLGELHKNNANNSTKHFQSKLHSEIIEEEEKTKRQYFQKKNMIKELDKKKEEYAEIVRTNFKPLAKKDTNEEEKHEKQPNRSLSVIQLRKKGNQYMKKAHENLANLKGSNITKVQKMQAPFKYKNYLQHLKIDRKSDTSEDPNNYFEQINALMRKENMTEEEKFFHAKVITKKIDSKPGRPSQKMIESINAKIHLLKQISNGIQ